MFWGAWWYSDYVDSFSCESWLVSCFGDPSSFPYTSSGRGRVEAKKYLFYYLLDWKYRLVIDYWFCHLIISGSTVHRLLTITHPHLCKFAWFSKISSIVRYWDVNVVGLDVSFYWVGRGNLIDEWTLIVILMFIIWFCMKRNIIYKSI